MGLSRRSHHSKLLSALNIPSIEDVIMKNSIRLYQNIFKTDSPSRDLQSILLSRYVVKGIITKGSLLEKIVAAGHNPLNIIFDKKPFACSESDIVEENDGMLDSLRYLLNHEDYNKPWSKEHILTSLLTKAF